MNDSDGRKGSGRGVFYHRILRSLLIASLIFALISISIFIVVIKQIAIVEKESDTSAYINQLNSLNIAEMSLSQMLSTLDTFALDSWLDSSVDDNYRYYYALRLYSWLSTNNGSMGDTIYRSAIISRSDDGMVITPTGTCSLDYYLDKYANLSEESIGVLIRCLDERCSSSFSFSVYDESGAITDAYIARPYITDRGGYAIILSRFYISRFLVLQDNEDAALIGTGGQIILGNSSSESSAAFIEAADSFRAGESESHMHAAALASHQWYFISHFRSTNTAAIYLLVWIALIIIFSVLMYFLVFRQAELLYSPLSEVISGGDPGLVIGKDTDEIGLLIKKNEECRALLGELSHANAEMARYEEVSADRDLLEGNVTADCPDDSSYYVAIVRFQSPDGRDVSSISFQLALSSYKDKGISYVPYGSDRIAVIMRMESDAKEILLELLHSCPDESDITAVLSRPVKGKGMLHTAYDECLKLLGCSSILGSYRIITSDDVAGLNMRDDFSYSSDDEAFLLKLILSGNPQASEELHEICSRNSEGLSYDAQYSFALCLSSTLSRLFSELKKSPEEMIGHEVSIADIIDEKSPSVIVQRTEEVFLEVISSICNSKSESDYHMISMMKRYIHENYMNNIGLQNMADKFNITPKYCGAIFSRLSSDNFKNYLNQYRVEEAKKIINDNPSVKVQDLAAMVGFNSPNTFIRVFSKYTGMTPKSYADIIAFSKN